MTGPNPPYTRILPGMYQDRDGNAVFNAADFLIENGIEDTPENRRQFMTWVEEMLAQVNQGQGQPMQMIYRTPEDPKWRRRSDDHHQ